MRVLHLIPARAGSKGLPGKNVRQLGGRPLLAWSILAAAPPLDMRMNRPVKDYEQRIVVSTDSEQIAAIARQHGAESLLRPAALATDEAETDPVILHALDHMKAEGWRPDLVVLLQPTVPVRREGLVRACIAQLLETGASSLLTVNRLHFVWAFDNCWHQVGDRERRRRQDIRRPYFHEDGSVYVTRTDLLERTGQRLGGAVDVYETERTVDIDTEDDFRMAAVLLRCQSIREASVA